MFAVLRHPIPELLAFTVCLWLRPAEGGIGTPLSYAVPEQPNELVLLQGLHTPTELLVNDKVTPDPGQGKSRDWDYWERAFQSGCTDVCPELWSNWFSRCLGFICDFIC